MSAAITPAAALTAAYEEYVAAARARDDARIRARTHGTRSEYLKADRAMYAALEKYNALKESARTAFAASRGWRYDKKRWVHVTERGHYERRIVKNPEFFRDKEGNTVGLITHTNAKHEEVAGYAARNGYNAEVLPFSWLYPDIYDAVLLTLKAGATWPK
jgi:hypothetical protein